MQCRALAAALPIVLLFVMLLSLPSLAEDKSVSPALSPSITLLPNGDAFPGMAIELDASDSTHSLSEQLVDEVRYIWDLGDGTFQMGEQITHRYAEARIFRVILTMEVFENSGIFHRSAETIEVEVAQPSLPRFVTVLSLDTGFTYPGILIQLQDSYVLIDPENGSANPPTAPVGTLFKSTLDLERFVVSGGLLSVGELQLWDVRIAMELPADGWLGFVGFGLAPTEASISLTKLYPAVESMGYDLAGIIDQANLVTLGVGYELMPNFYLLATIGSLYVSGAYEGSSRLTLDDELLPAPFTNRISTLSFGLGIRIRWAMLSLQVLLAL
jgi:PKD domain-containing protein